MTEEKVLTLKEIAERRERSFPTFARKGIVTYGAICLLIFFFVGELSLQKVMVIHAWSVERLSSTYCTGNGNQDPRHLDPFSSGFDNLPLYNVPKFLIDRPTLHEAYEGKVTYLSNLTWTDRQRPSGEFKTVIDPNRNVFNYGLTVVKNVCMRPEGPIVMVGMSEEEILTQVSPIPDLNREWFSTYNCSRESGCSGFELVDTVPEDVKWVNGTTTHIVPYLGNVFHHFADRVWPHVAGFQYPLNETSGHPIDHFLVHRISTWLLQAYENMDRNTLMYQIRLMAMLTPDADFLALDGMEEQVPQDLVCYERLVLACTTCDRVSDKLGHNITKPALLRYRNIAFSYFGVEEPTVSLPPRPLRVAIYGRSDTKRRRVSNIVDVVEHLRNYTNPPLDVIAIDEILADGTYNQSLPEVVSLYSQVDIFITVHGANTWAALFMPKYAGIIEIHGPCGPSTWLNMVVKALDLKHDSDSNPWGEKVASPLAGNTLKCKNSLETPDFTVDIEKLDRAIHQLALPSFGHDDRIPRHWLHNWSRR